MRHAAPASLSTSPQPWVAEKLPDGEVAPKARRADNKRDTPKALPLKRI